jgi:hypothetical protein
MKDLEEGDTVELEKPYRGYTKGEIVGWENYKYIVRFSSGMEAKFYKDEFKEER